MGPPLKRLEKLLLTRLLKPNRLLGIVYTALGAEGNKTGTFRRLD